MPSSTGGGHRTAQARRTCWLASACAIGALLAALAVSGCKESARVTEVTEAPGTVEPAEMAEAAGQAEPSEPEAEQTEAPAAAQGGKSVVKISTEKGDILVELFDREAPITAGSFLLLADVGFYDGVPFHRVEPGFVIQGGDPTGTGEGGPGFTIPNEATPELKHDRGVLSMARSTDPDSAGSQFFICLGGPRRVGHLDGGYAVFGKVIEGMEVADQIKPGDKMVEVTIVSESPDAEAAKQAARKGRVPK